MSLDSHDVQRAAILSAKGLKQREIAVEMPTSLSTVTRLLKDARKQGILLPARPALDLGKIDDAVWDQLCGRDLVAEIQQRLGPHGVDKVRLARTHATDHRETEFRVMRTAALHLAKVIQGLKARRPQAMRAPVLGFTSGSMLSSAVDHADLPTRVKGVSLVALGGDPAVLPIDVDYTMALQTSANGIVGKLASRLRQPKANVWRFPLPVAWSPVPETPVSLLRALARGVPAVATILGSDAAGHDPGSPEPLIDQMGTIFAELAPPQQSKPGAEDAEWVAGRINGHLVARRGTDGVATGECERRNGFAPGASPSDLARVAARLRPHYLDGRGVILVASGMAAADGVLALVTAKAVNELIIDTETARAILRALRRPVHREEIAESARAAG